MAILADAETTILVQGITGREASTFTSESLQYGAQIVAGVTPGKGGQETHGIPVFDTVAAAVHARPAAATIIAVPAPFVRDAALEALASGIELLVIVTERVPRKDIVVIMEKAVNVGARVVGPNSLGVISPDRTRVGMCGGAAADVRRAYMRGGVGIMSRSGGMMTELASHLTQAGIGQSTCVSVGGDPIVGSTFVDLLPLYEADPETEALVLFCEPGGTMEEKFAGRLMQQPSRLPVVAFIAGKFADRMHGVRFGHAGAIVEGDKGSPTVKAKVLEAAGVRVASRFNQISEYVREMVLEAV